MLLPSIPFPFTCLRRLRLVHDAWRSDLDLYLWSAPFSLAAVYSANLAKSKVLVNACFYFYLGIVGISLGVTS